MPKHQLKPYTIYCGDNLKMLKEIPDETVDLIYKESEVEIILITVKELLRRESFGTFD